MVGLWVENKSSPVQQYRIIFDDAKEERVSPSSPTKPVGWISKNSVSSTTSFSRACARYSDDALFAFTTFTVTHYCCPKNEWNSRTYAKKRGRFFRKSPTFFQKRPTFSRKAPSFLITPSHNPKKHCNHPQLLSLLPHLLFHPNLPLLRGLFAHFSRHSAWKIKKMFIKHR